MVAATQARGWEGPTRRRIPRFLVQVPIDVTVLRSGIPDTLPGRSVNLCERGLAALLAGELLPGETVGVEVRLPPAADPLRTRALVRHQDKVRCGMEFVALSAEQQAAIRHWVQESRMEAEPEGRSSLRSQGPHHAVGTTDLSSPGPPKPNWKRRSRAVAMLLMLLAIVAAIFWWRWNRSWEQLETELANQRPFSAEQPRVQVPAEVMQKLLIHRVEPDYPAAARKERLRGIIVLRVVVGQDGSVVNMHPVNGPDLLAGSAMDAVRAWKFEPYRINGEPATVETTVAVEVKP